MAGYTSMDFTLSSTLLSNLTGTDNSVYVYAFAFDGTGNLLGSTTLISDGAVEPDGNFSLALTSSATPQVKGGNVVIVTQQTGPGGTSTLLSDVHKIGDVLDTDAATASNYRYDAIEFTLTNTGSDVADLTNIVQFGRPMELSVSYSALPTDTRGYAVSGQSLVTNLIALSPAGSQDYPWTAPGNAPLTDQRETLALANNVHPNPLNVAAYWNTYVTKFETTATGTDGVVKDVYLASYFNGVAGGPPPSLSFYDVQYDKAEKVFWLVPVDIEGVSTTNYAVKIPFSALTSNIYTQAGTLDVYTAKNGTLVAHYDTFTPNNAYGNIVKYLVAGFDAGFWGGSADSPNPLATEKVDLDQTWNWSANYAYEAINAPSGTNNLSADCAHPLFPVRFPETGG